MVIVTRTKEEYYHRISQEYNAAGIDPHNIAFPYGHIEFRIDHLDHGKLYHRNRCDIIGDNNECTTITSPWEVGKR